MRCCRFRKSLPAGAKTRSGKLECLSRYVRVGKIVGRAVERIDDVGCDIGRERHADVRQKPRNDFDGGNACGVYQIDCPVFCVIRVAVDVDDGLCAKKILIFLVHVLEPAHMNRIDGKNTIGRSRAAREMHLIFGKSVKSRSGFDDKIKRVPFDVIADLINGTFNVIEGNDEVFVCDFSLDFLYADKSRKLNRHGIRAHNRHLFPHAGKPQGQRKRAAD